MQEALLKVKMDLGSDAVILNTRKMKRPGMFSFLRSPLIEVLASLEEEENETKTIAAEVNNAKVEQLEDKMHDMEEMLAKIYKQMSERQTDSLKNAVQKTADKPSSSIYNVFIENMKQNDVEQTVIDEIMTALRRNGIDDDTSMNEAFSTFQKELISRLGASEGIRLEENKKPKVVMFLGPTGVGKTTTLAKLAANFMIKEKKKVGMITADTYRIAAVEQLKTYSEIMGTSITVIYSPKEMKDAIKKHAEDDLILIDTPGKSHKNKKHFDEIKEIVKAAEPDEAYLLISATTKMKDCKELIKAYSFIDKYKLIFTKLDETSSPGVVLNVKEITGKPLSYVTTGQSVPDDIELIDVENLSKKLLGNN